MESKSKDLIGSKRKDYKTNKTEKALYDTLFMMLGKRNFNSITVNSLCSKALVSRAAFYTHFTDKYDLLKYLLVEIRKVIIKDIDNYEKLEDEVNQFISSNKKFITNILEDANSETLELINEFMTSIVELAIKKKFDRDLNPRHIILYNFIVGGLSYMLECTVKNSFHPKINLMNPHLYSMLEYMVHWDTMQDLKDNVTTYIQTKNQNGDILE